MTSGISDHVVKEIFLLGFVARTFMQIMTDSLILVNKPKVLYYANIHKKRQVVILALATCLLF